MKHLIYILLLFPLISLASPKDQHKYFKVACPNCLTVDSRLSKSILSTGGYASEVKGIKGNMQQRTATFRCKECRKDFSSPIKPDKFVPILPAVEIASKPVR